MTRVNLVPPSELYDQHLIAEYRELPMVPAALERSLRSINGLPEIPKRYTLGKGHVTFFYNKGMFLAFRYLAIFEEMRARLLNPNPYRMFPVEVFTLDLWNDWTPSEQDIALSRKRIAERIAQKPNWYRKTQAVLRLAEMC